MNKKNRKILIIIILSGILITVFYQIVARPLSEGQGDFKSIKKDIVQEKNIQVSLSVQNKKYNTEIKEGSTVFEVMHKIKTESKPPDIFDFKYKEYPSLGIFMDEINGLSGSLGKYWIYYVNGKEASVGVSKNIIKNGDIISWQQK
ncbi:MAG: DUF4430 domain-containing protein [Bacteroidetes bacterium]|nr:DUF4430 domain-containing protein [Bacteroidota bacterium]